VLQRYGSYNHTFFILGADRDVDGLGARNMDIRFLMVYILGDIFFEIGFKGDGGS